jgi:transposase
MLMSSRNARTYDNEFKNNAVNLYNEGGTSYKEVASNLGIPQATLVGWVHEKQKSGDNAFPGKGHLKPEEARIKLLERENEKLKRERDILKKALAIFSLP